MRRRSSREDERQKKYRIAKAEHLAEHPYCQACGLVRPGLPPHRAMWIHHKKGKLGDLLWDRRWFCSIDGECHLIVEKRREWAYSVGLLLDRLAHD